MSIKSPAPASDEAIDDSKPILVFNHAGTSSSNSFMHQVRTTTSLSPLRATLARAELTLRLAVRSSGILGSGRRSTSSRSTRATLVGQEASL